MGRSIIARERGSKTASPARGWHVVAGAFGVMFVTFGAAYSFSAFFASLQQEFAASRGDVALVFSIAVPLYFLTGAVSGPLAPVTPAAPFPARAA
jgi:hypothetical protein